MELFELRKPLKLSDDKYLLKMGSPFINHNNQKCFNDGFMSVYRDFSITHTNKSTYYLFACVYIREH